VLLHFGATFFLSEAGLAEDDVYNFRSHVSNWNGNFAAFFILNMHNKVSL